MSARARQHQRFEEVFDGVEAPFAFLDLDAVRSNAREMISQAAGKPIRIASKSVRSVPVLRRLLDLDPGFRGVLAFTLPEALHLCNEGFDDIVLAYPTMDRRALAELAALATELPQTHPAPMVDGPEQLDAICEAAGNGAPIRVCIELDMGWRPARGRVRLGPKRSPIRTPGQAHELAREIDRRPETRLIGLMAYEGQIAGVGDDPPGNPLRRLAIRWMQARSMRDVVRRRAGMVDAVRSVAPDLELVNGGGTGSLARTAAEDAVTELAAGSGFYAPALFDHYRSLDLRPGAMFCLQIVRRPDPDVATALGGGYIASGPSGADRQPEPWLPEGLSLDPLEMAGEVQTPLRGPAARALAVGDRVYLRHAKAGELCERFDRLYLVEGDRIVDEVPTYRGEGLTFL